jgi:hypothetical protein
MPHTLPRIPGIIPAAVALALTLGGAGTSAASAQSLWMPRDRESAVMLELLKPSFDTVDEDFTSFAGFLGFRSTPKSNVSVALEASMARIGYDEFDPFSGITSSVSSFSLGDIYLGLEYGNSAGPFFGEMGVRLPTSSESEGDARLTGVLSDLTRWEAFLSKTVTFQGAGNFRKVASNGLYYRLRLSPTLAVPTQAGLDPELFFVYSGQFGVERPQARLGVGLVARTLITESDLTFSERTETQLDGHVDLGAGSFRPGVEVKVPLDDQLNDFTPVTVGVSFSYSH